MLLADIPPKGSSPLARGTLEGDALAHVKRGLIPARAGNTGAIFAPAPVIGAHPRSRGEHSLLKHWQIMTVGSSPLARGTPVPAAAFFGREGLIPARAGNTCSRCSRSIWCRAHPRSRGEHVSAAKTSNRPQGSSPLARGTLVAAARRAFAHGLIPARAGNTCRCRFHRARPWAHPRSRGEHATW